MPDFLSLQAQRSASAVVGHSHVSLACWVLVTAPAVLSGLCFAALTVRLHILQQASCALFGFLWEEKKSSLLSVLWSRNSASCP